MIATTRPDRAARTLSSRGPARRRRARSTLAAALLAVAFVAPAEFRESEAFAADYPTWEEVQAARSSEETKKTEIARIQSLIGGLERQVAEAQAVAMQRGTEYEAATIAYDEAAYRADQLRSAAEQARDEAEKSNRQAGVLASQLARAGGSDLQLSMFSGGGDADRLLYQIGAMSKLTEKAGAIYERAVQDRNTAQSLTDQATVARDALEGLRIAAENALKAAVDAQAALEGSLVEQRAQSIVLAAQLELLTSQRQTTEAEYQAGVEERRRQAEAAAAAERERRAREAEEAARREASGGGGGGGGGSGGGGGQGWTNPLPGHRVTDEWGNRFHPIDAVWRLHAGIDLVKAGGGTCGATVYAASSGRVVYAGYNGGLGNAVEIDHGGGRRTVYGHNTTVLVRSGWEVSAGQPIAYAGTTGASTGCHLHFETRVNGQSQNPRTFLGQYGVGF